MTCNGMETQSLAVISKGMEVQGLAMETQSGAQFSKGMAKNGSAGTGNGMEKPGRVQIFNEQQWT